MNVASKSQGKADSKRAVIPFERPQAKTLEKGQYHTYKLRTVPTDTASPVYELTVPFFSSGTAEEWIKFRRGVAAVLAGQNVTTGPASYALVKTLLKGDALTVFQTAEVTFGNQTLANFQSCLNEVTTHVFPEKAAQLQKRYLRRCLVKDEGVPVKEWVARVLELNECLREFPIVNGVSETKLSDAEIMEILEYGVPREYRREFTVQGFDPLTQGLKKFIEFCTRLEAWETSLEKPIPKKAAYLEEFKTGSRKRKAKADKEEKAGSGIRLQYCRLHGENLTHSTSECFELNRQSKRAKEFENIQRQEKKTVRVDRRTKNSTPLLTPKWKRLLKNVVKPTKRKRQRRHVTLNLPLTLSNVSAI